MKIRNKIVIQGQVQGVGCRPFIYRLASQFDLTGLVFNDSKGVVVEIQGVEASIKEFLKTLEQGSDRQWPPLMNITSIRSTLITEVPAERTFEIRKSPTAADKAAHVTADTATCSECLSEMNDPGDFRYRYPFINCTNCGPRYTIVKTIPYDRCNTTMAGFQMCDKCAEQYNDPNDRRFHAQPVACPECGPVIRQADSNGKDIETDSDKVISGAAAMLRDGKILAIKGLGGFHLAVDAKNETAVQTLRQRKLRDHKPFALMASSVGSVSQYAEVDDVAARLLQSPQSPIVLLPGKGNSDIAPSVGQGLGTLGFMLCYTPLHQLLFAEDGIDVLVMTSANLSDEPLICDNDEAIEKLGGIADAFVMHDRDIYRQVDDSIVHVVEGGAALIRRSRGYSPRPVIMETAAEKQIFAAGADMKNTFCFVKGDQLILSEHIGDLEDSRVYRHYVESIKHLQSLFDIQPEVFVSDLHPSYLSTQYAQSISGSDVIQVQHHWAHIASVLAEYDYHDKVIGLVADGTGLGSDGAVWGCECLIASLGEFERFGHLRYFPLAGGDSASKQALRPLLGLLSNIEAGCDDIINTIEPDGERVRMIQAQISKNINTVQTSSMGRLFDAVAAMLGLGSENQFEAQLPMRLESALQKGVEEAYSVSFMPDGSVMQLDYVPMLNELLEDKQSGVPAGVISAKFHNWAAGAMVEFAMKARQATGIETVALSGGVFCNNYLANRTIQLLKKSGFFVLFKRTVPANDGGVALGQAAIAAERFKA